MKSPFIYIIQLNINTIGLTVLQKFSYIYLSNFYKLQYMGTYFVHILISYFGRRVSLLPLSNTHSCS